MTIQKEIPVPRSQNDNQRKGLPPSIDLLRTAIISLENTPDCAKRKQHFLDLMLKLQNECKEWCFSEEEFVQRFPITSNKYIEQIINYKIQIAKRSLLNDHKPVRNMDFVWYSAENFLVVRRKSVPIV